MKKLILKIFHPILYKYVELDSKYNSAIPNPFKLGDKVKPNWKALVYFDEQLPITMVITSIKKDNTIYMECGEVWCPYWLTKS